MCGNLYDGMFGLRWVQWLLFWLLRKLLVLLCGRLFVWLSGNIECLLQQLRGKLFQWLHWLLWRVWQWMHRFVWIGLCELLFWLQRSV